MDAASPQPNGDRLTLTPVTAETWRAVADLEVTEAQRAFVTAPTRYLALCAYGGVWQPLAVRLGDRVIGFVMWAVDPDDGSCWFGGLLIGRQHQRQGHGRRTLEALMERLTSEHGHRRFALAYHPDNPARALYRALGFMETGEVDGDEVVARWERPDGGATEVAGPRAIDGRTRDLAAWEDRPIVREGTRVDLPAVVALLADDPLGATRERPGDPVDPAYVSALAGMRAQGGNELIVAERGRVVVGCLQLVVIPGLTRTGMKRAQIEGVRVARAHRGQGVGAALVQAALDRAVAAGCGLVQLTTDVSRSDAKRFYERFGFVASHHGMKRPVP